MAEELRAEMAATVQAVLVPIGAEVAAGQPLLMLESMKMEIPVEAEVGGRLARLAVAPGDRVAEGDLLAVLE